MNSKGVNLLHEWVKSEIYTNCSLKNLEGTILVKMWTAILWFRIESCVSLTPIEPQINKPRRGKGCTGSGIIICCRRRVQSVMLPLSSCYFLCHCSKCSFQHIVHGLLVGHSRNINVYVHDLLLFLARAAVCGGVVHHYQQSGCLYWPVLTLQRGPILLCSGSVRHLVWHSPEVHGHR